MKRIINTEACGLTLDVFITSAVYRAEIRDAEENIVMGASAANLDGSDSVLESVESFFTARRDHTTGKALVEGARIEMNCSGIEARPAVPGWKLAEVINEKLRVMASRETPEDIRLRVELTNEQRTEIAAAAALACKLKFDIRERT